ncbi:MAG TPA: ParA family partition ATPase [Stellaceae bacterium]|nr:ParA family partition ATPase [Stellaceae bacterium]
MAATIITIAQQKGGAGKTTLAAHLALAWAAKGRRVAVIDIDPQASLSTWFQHRRERQRGLERDIDVAAITGWRVTAEVERQARSHDVVLVDSPPHAATEARIAVRAAGLVLIPVQPSPMDLWATKATLELARSERVPALLVLNRVPPRANLTDAMMAAFLALNVPLAQTQIGNRVALASSLAEGKGILEAAPGSKAAEEIDSLAHEILGIPKDALRVA